MKIDPATGQPIITIDMKALRITTFIASLLASLALTFWPPLLYHEGVPPSHGQTSLLLAGLCVGVVYGSGILKRTPKNLHLACALFAWITLVVIAWRALSL